MNFIKKISDKNFDADVHSQFQKFSKGEFKDRAIVKVKFSANKYTITTTAEFANEFVKIVAEKLGENQTIVKGGIITTLNIDIDYKDKKQFQGVKKYLIEKEMSGKDILELLNEFPKAFFALTFNAGDSILKIKPKAPKSAKPKTKGEAPKPDFCKLITTDAKIGQSFVLEKSDFKLAEINNTFIITDIIKPKGEIDFAKIRELAKRKGKILRKALIDGQEINSELEFEA